MFFQWEMKITCSIISHNEVREEQRVTGRKSSLFSSVLSPKSKPLKLPSLLHLWLRWGWWRWCTALCWQRWWVWWWYLATRTMMFEENNLLSFSILLFLIVVLNFELMFFSDSNNELWIISFYAWVVCSSSIYKTVIMLLRQNMLYKW